MSPERSVPDKPSLEGLEARWGEAWEREGTYRFDRTKTRDRDLLDRHAAADRQWLPARRPRVLAHPHRHDRPLPAHAGPRVFYPMGWDDNGVPTERRVENFYGVRCDPTRCPTTPTSGPRPSRPKGNRRDDLVRCSRRNFIDLCFGLTAEDEQAFEELWRHLGLSVDWSLTYTTIDDQSRRASQRAFLRNLARGEAYQSEAPTLWDVRFEMAVVPGRAGGPRAARGLPPGRRSGGTAATRWSSRPPGPSCIPACVALVAHPDDERYQPLFETQVRTPLFGVPVPVKAHRLADPEKGTGIAMICTFGDTTDVTWWRELDLPVRAVVGRNGRLLRRRPRRVHRRGRPTSTSPSSPARPCSAPRSASSSCWARPGRCGASPARSPTR